MVMLEVNAVLANKFDAANYVPASSNINTDSVEEVPSSSSEVDARRYTQFDRSITNAGSTTMSFGDFVDMVNPLQHIPLVSSVYRSITGDTINPVARIVGDMMYSAPLGLASAGISGLNALANSALEASTGNDGMGYVMAALFGTDNSSSEVADNNADTVPSLTAMSVTSVASASIPAPSIPVTSAPLDVLASTSSPASSPASAPKNISPSPQAAKGTPAPTPVPASSSQVADAASTVTAPSKFFALDRVRINTKNPTMDTNDVESQNRIISLSEGSHAMRLGHTIYTSPLMNGPKPMPIGSVPPVTVQAPPTQAASVQSPTTAINTASTTEITPTDLSSPLVANSAAQASILSSTKNTPIPSGLFDDAMILKRLSQYKDFAATPVPNGATLDVSN